MIASILPPGMVATAQEESDDPPVQIAVIDEDFGYLNLSDRGGRPPGEGVDDDGPPPLQQASLTTTFSNFTINGIPFDDWSACRATSTVDQCLEALVADSNGDGVKQVTELHPGAIGGGHPHLRPHDHQHL